MDVKTGAIGNVLPKLRKLLEEEDNLAMAVKDDIQSIISELENLHAALRKLAEVPPDQLGKVAKVWARYARELSYRIEDRVDLSLNFQTKGKVRHNMSFVLEDFRTLVEIRQRCESHEAEFVGVEEARDELIKILTEGDKHQTKIVSIVGFGGLGKTALVIMVYRKLISQFDCGFFCSVSPNPDMKKIFKSMLYQLDEKTYANIHDVEWDEGQLIKVITELLRNKRYLIVIDDLWDPNIWDVIRSTLPNNHYGSRVITTTRIYGMAKKCCSGHDELIYEMKHLGYQNSKRLFLKRIFGSVVSCPDTLREVLDEVLKMCGGMPLAIISFASLLRNKVTTKESWFGSLEKDSVTQLLPPTQQHSEDLLALLGCIR